jgi:hypothetical protein
MVSLTDETEQLPSHSAHIFTSVQTEAPLPEERVLQNVTSQTKSRNSVIQSVGDYRENLGKRLTCSYIAVEMR